MMQKQPRWAQLLIASTAAIALACTVALALQTLDDHASAQIHESGVLPGSDDMATQQGLLPGQINPTAPPDSMTDILNRMAQKASPPPPADPLSDMADLLIWLPQHIARRMTRDQDTANLCNPLAILFPSVSPVATSSTNCSAKSTS
ncbi:hypothetical protein ACAG26_26310 [Mycobacterium sp. pUA109]